MLKLVVRRDGCWMWLSLSVLALAVSVAFSRPVAAQRLPNYHFRVRQTATQSLTLIKPTDSDFQGTLDEYFPGLSSKDGYETVMKPFLVIVRNDTDLSAVSYAVLWTVQYTQGGAQRMPFRSVDRPFMFQRVRNSIKPGEVRLISPWWDVTPQKFLGTLQFPGHYSARHFPPSRDLVSTDAAVDGVVYSDGSFVGADTTKILERHVMAKFAARDEALEVLRVIKASPAIEAGPQLLKLLGEERMDLWKAHQQRLLARYVRARGRSANDFQSILKERGVSGLQTELQNFVDRSGRGENASMFDKVYRNLSPGDPRVFGTLPYKAN